VNLENILCVLEVLENLKTSMMSGAAYPPSNSMPSLGASKKRRKTDEDIEERELHMSIIAPTKEEHRTAAQDARTSASQQRDVRLPVRRDRLQRVFGRRGPVVDMQRCRR